MGQKTFAETLHPKLSHDKYFYSILKTASTRVQLLTGCYVNLQNYCKLFGHTLLLEELTGYFVKQYFIVNYIITVSSITDHRLKPIRFKGDKVVKIYETEKHSIYLRESSKCLICTE